MKTTPKALRLHIGIFGRTNVGKSSYLNMIAGQDVAITSPVPGTTTDVVEKTMELLPLGPVVFLDTAGLDDVTELAEKRLQKGKKIYERSDIILLLTEDNQWSSFEDEVCKKAKEAKIPVITVVNKIDLSRPQDSFLEKINATVQIVLQASCLDNNSEVYRQELKNALISVCPDDFLRPPTLIGDLLSSGSIGILIVPIDLEAPKGRLILPQVQTIRDVLDNDAATLVVKEREYAHVLKQLKSPPKLVVCDSQVVLKMVADTPSNVPCTTFSILFARYKGDLVEAAKGAARIETLKAHERILIAEACSHHPIEDDIGRVKIPRWIRQYVGGAIDIKTVSGRDFPDNLKEFKVIIHCGGCMFNRREMLFRIEKAKENNVPITNYGICIAALHGVVERVLAPFPAALTAYREEKGRLRKHKSEGE